MIFDKSIITLILLKTKRSANKQGSPAVSNIITRISALLCRYGGLSLLQRSFSHIQNEKDQFCIAPRYKNSPRIKTYESH